MLLACLLACFAGMMGGEEKREGEGGRERMNADVDEILEMC